LSFGPAIYIYIYRTQHWNWNTVTTPQPLTLAPNTEGHRTPNQGPRGAEKKKKEEEKKSDARTCTCVPFSESGPRKSTRVLCLAPKEKEKENDIYLAKEGQGHWCHWH
jgi:hypothetical protein